MKLIQKIVKALKRRYYLARMDICAERMHKSIHNERVWLTWFLRYNDHLARLYELED